MKKLLAFPVIAGLALSGCAGPVPVPVVGPISYADFWAGLQRATIIECQFVPLEAVAIAIFNAGASQGFKYFADQICQAVTAKSAAQGITVPTIVVNGVRIPIQGKFVQ